MHLPSYSGLTLTTEVEAWKWRRMVGQETWYTGPQFFKYKIMPTEVKGGDLHSSFPTTDFTGWNQRLFYPGLITARQPFCCISEITQCVLEGFNVGHSERTGYLHIGKLVATSAQESGLFGIHVFCSIKFIYLYIYLFIGMYVCVVNLYMYFI